MHIITKLQEVLQSMSVEVTQEALSCAPVITIHYAKNIALTDGSTPYHYIQKIKDANIRLSLDTNQTDYRNAGHSYKWHCNTYEVAFYDKIKDLEKGIVSDKRAIEKDNALQIQLLEGFKKRRRKFELLRMEVRLNKRQKIKQLFKTVGAAAELTFKKLFKPALAKKVLLHYLDELEAQRPALLNYKMRDGKALLADLIMNNPTLGPKQILQLYGFKQALEIMTPRELRAMFANYNQRSWYRLIAGAAKVSLPAVISPFKEIREQLNAFKPVKILKG